MEEPEQVEQQTKAVETTKEVEENAKEPVQADQTKAVGPAEEKVDEEEKDVTAVADEKTPKEAEAETEASKEEKEAPVIVPVPVPADAPRTKTSPPKEAGMEVEYDEEFGTSQVGISGFCCE